jgi:phosphoribosylformylglycinamidine synthase
MAVVIRHPLHPKIEVTVELYRVPVQIVPRPGILDPQGAAVVGALRSLGFDSISDVRVGRFVTVDVSAESADAAAATVSRMCEKLLANPVIEDFALETPTVRPRAGA